MNLQCPFCQTQITNSAKLLHCPECDTEIMTDSEGHLDSYYLLLVYKNRRYWACFENIKSPRFTIQYWNEEKKLCTLLTLPYFPNITPANFPDKLKTFLTFS